MNVTVVDNAQDLETHERAWQDLASHAIERNAFYEPWLLLPAIPTLGRDLRILYVLIYEAGGPGASRLCGFFPLEMLTQFRNVPVKTLRLWKHMHCFLCAPLIRAGRSRETLAALREWARTDIRADILDFSYVSGDGPFQQLLVEHVHETHALSCTTGSFTRAFWRNRGEDAEAYFEAVLSPGVRKEYRRQHRRLEELGGLEFRSASPDAGLDEWLRAFLHLEASGWKAREGTAMALNQDQLRFIGEVTARGWARRQVGLHGLFLDERPLAMLLCFQSGAGLFAFKIAYDEAFAKFSPGVQMTLGLLAQLHAHPGIDWLDACAMPDHPMINRLLSDRRIVQSVLLSTGTWSGDLLVSAYPLARLAGRAIREARRKFSRFPAGATSASLPGPT